MPRAMYICPVCHKNVLASKAIHIKTRYYYINDDYTFKEDVPFFGFKKGTDSKEVFKWQNI